ncbi:MAG: ATP-binding protein [Nanoarchaeota archaeon]|nr:ATP-binding protein [Nanoarchaeota archaeon]
MDANNAINYANSLIEIANKKENPAEKRALLLEAAENYIKASKNTMGQQSQYYYKLASELYLQSQKLRENNFTRIKKIKNKPKIAFKNVGGLKRIKEQIKMKIIEPLLHPEIFKYFGKKAGGGILMYGPPGCGKSLIAEATAGEADVNFFNIKASDIKSKYLGEAEKKVAKIFEDARREKAAILFFDEFESLGTDRTRMGHNTRGIVSMLLAEMDGLGNKEQNILVIAATNEPWNIDSALKRSGRFDEMIFIRPPDIKARKEILKIHLKNRPIDNINYESIAKATENFSGADIKALCEEATDIPLKEYLMFKVKRKICNADFFDALKFKKSTVYPWFNRARQILEKRGETNLFPEIMAMATQVS